ncbi:hypothetical protein PFISCL1PPCAC_12093, partial [Pristionchus fissidentatus]
ASTAVHHRFRLMPASRDDVTTSRETRENEMPSSSSSSLYTTTLESPRGSSWAQSAQHYLLQMLPTGPSTELQDDPDLSFELDPDLSFQESEVDKEMDTTTPPSPSTPIDFPAHVTGADSVVAQQQPQAVQTVQQLQQQ